MADFLPTIEEHRHHPQQQQQHQHQQQQAKQTIKERDTNSFQVSTSTSTSKSNLNFKTATLKVNSTGKFRENFSSAEDNEELESPVAGVAAVKKGDIRGIYSEQVGKQTKPSFAEDKTQFIDSRSILSNKERLKKFWEHKMEMEFKLKQQHQQKQQRQSPLRISNNNNNKALDGKQKPVELDQNNNRGSNNKLSNNNCSADIGGGGGVGVGDADGHQQELQVQCASDEEWRSLSPNVEPTTLNGPFNKSFKNVANSKQVSVELICEKLREYQANNGADTHISQRVEANGHAKASSEETGQQVDSNLADRLSNGDGTGSNGSSKQVPNNCKNISSNNYDNINNNCSLDETQLMSIDPTLCHSRAGGGGGVGGEGGGGGGEALAVNAEENNNSYNFVGEKSYPEEVTSSSSLAEDLVTTYNKQREEQTVNEEFSSSSNSSFGPMSISIPREEPNLSKGEQPSVKGNTALINSDEDDLSSAQSGSVLTVINKLDTTDLKNCQSFDISQQDLMLSDLEKASPLCSNNVTSLQSDSSASMMMPQSMVNESKKQSDPDAGAFGEDADQDESGSNIGVAFESLQFDSEIKSSKHEKVEDELLIAPAPVKRPAIPKFNANEVKSVCNFITNAITDATRQVESYITGQSSATLSQKQQINEHDHSRGSIQRATFIPHQSDTFDGSISSTTNYDGVNGKGGLNDEHNNDGDDDDDDNDDDNYANDVQQAVEDETDIPSADLTSIFEANVQREIERFETNSMMKKSLGGKLTDMNGLTKWRIAEEIRQFNEREMELKRRLEGDRKKDAETPAINGDFKPSDSANDPVGELNNQENLLKQQETAFTVVRFGKTLQIPKPSSSPATSQDSSQTNSLMPCKSIKLSTSSGTSSNSSTISMHKFIASGGKRFVLTGSSTGNNFNANCTLQNQGYLTKSMSNLSSNLGGQQVGEAQRVADYKAVDSLKCKETPNVKPGLTRKVIETFSRLSHRSRFESQQSLAASNTKNHQVTSASSSQLALNSQHLGNCNTNGAPSAEWKIQEELREMRAREAELRNQRNHSAGNKVSDGKVENNQASLHPEYQSGDSAEMNERLKNDDEQIKAIDRSPQVGCHLSPRESSIDAQSNFSNESLYPIKQTIDSFKKLNSSSQTNYNNITTTNTRQNSGSTGGNQQRSQQASDDYESKVGGQRRKISMIEKWENRLNL